MKGSLRLYFTKFLIFFKCNLSVSLGLILINVILKYFLFTAHVLINVASVQNVTKPLLD